MPNATVCARLSVVIVGLKGDQFHEVESLLSGHPIRIREMSREKLLKQNHLNGLVVLTRFINHKHSNRARQIAPGRVIWVNHGTAHAVAAAIVGFIESQLAFL